MDSRAKKIPSESAEQQRLVLKIRWLLPNLQFFAIPNGGKRNPREARKLVLEGVEAGCPDLFVAKPSKGFHGLFIELKRAKKSLSKTSIKQIEKHKALRKAGYAVHVCYGATEAYSVIQEYLCMKK